MSMERLHQSQMSRHGSAQAPALVYAPSGGRSSGSLLAYANAKKQQIGGTGNGLRNIANGDDITTKVYPSDIIPDKNIIDQ